jgi:hypothetical protein
MARRGEVKHLSNHRKRKRRDSVSSGERKRNSPNREDLSPRGSGTLTWTKINEFNTLESVAIDRDSRVNEVDPVLEVSQVARCT